MNKLFSTAWFRAARISVLSNRTLVVSLLLLAMTVFWQGVDQGGVQANAAEIKQMVLHPKFQDATEFKRMKTAARRFPYSEEGAKNEEQTRYARAYYHYYVPAKITRLDSFSEISDLILDVRKRLKQSKPNTRPLMVSWLFDGMRPVAENNFHPAARINAVLMISSLESQPAVFSSKTAPKFFEEIPDVLVPIYLDPRNPDGVRAAALKGIRKYVKWNAGSLSSEHRKSLATSMRSLLSDPTPEHRDPVAHEYLKRFAIDILAKLDSTGNTELANTVLNLSVDESKPDLIAVFAASRLAWLDKESFASVDRVDTVLSRWAARAASAFEREHERLAGLAPIKPARLQPPKPESSIELKKPKVGPSMGRAMPRGMENLEPPMDEDMNDMGEMGDMWQTPAGPGFGPRQFAQQTPQVMVSRRVINKLVSDLHLGATGAATPATNTAEFRGLWFAANEREKRMIQVWSATVGKVLKELNAKTLDSDPRYMDALKAQVAVLRVLEKTMTKGGVPMGQADEPKDSFASQPILEPFFVE